MSDYKRWTVSSDGTAVVDEHGASVSPEMVVRVIQEMTKEEEELFCQCQQCGEYIAQLMKREESSA